MANLLPQIVFGLYPKEETLPDGRKHTHLVWRSVHETQATGAGQLVRVEAEWRIDPHTEHLVCAWVYTGGGISDLRTTLCGVGLVAEQEPGDKAQSFVGAIGHGELFGTIVEFSSTADCAAA